MLETMEFVTKAQSDAAKTAVQKRALQRWKERGCRGTLEITTGVGKTKIGMDAVVEELTKNPGARVMVVTPTEYLRDYKWPEEFRKWGFKSFLKKVDIQCIQSIYKIKDNTYDLVVADEVHNYTSAKYQLFFNNIMRKVLGLSAWIPWEREPRVKLFAPTVAELTTELAIEKGIISDFIELNIPVELNEADRETYNVINDAFLKIADEFGGGEDAFRSANTTIVRLSNKPYHLCSKWDHEHLNRAYAYVREMKKRSEFLYNNPTKIPYVHRIIDEVGLAQSLIFCQSTDVADQICAGRTDILPYHSNLPSEEATRTYNMRRFLDGRTRVNHLATCLAIQEGMDIPSLPGIITVSRTGKPKSHIQRRGRALRYVPGSVSVIFNLYYADTKDRVWLRSAQQGTDPKRIQWLDGFDDVYDFIENK